MSQRSYTDQIILLNALAANGQSTAALVISFRDIEIQFATANFSGTVKVVGSNADAIPDFSSASSGTNPWSYIQSIDQIDGSSIAGGTGVAYTTDTSVKNVEANTNGMKWIGVIVSSYTGGSITVKCRPYSMV